VNAEFDANKNRSSQPKVKAWTEYTEIVLGTADLSKAASPRGGSA
jgi:hypothetical protein